MEIVQCNVIPVILNAHDLCTFRKKRNMVHTWDPSTREAKAGVRSSDRDPGAEVPSGLVLRRELLGI